MRHHQLAIILVAAAVNVHFAVPLPDTGNLQVPDDDVWRITQDLARNRSMARRTNMTSAPLPNSVNGPTASRSDRRTAMLFVYP